MIALPPRVVARVALPPSSLAEGWIWLAPMTNALPWKRVRVAGLKNMEPMSLPPAEMPA